jgi:membrane protein YqaA with SNARE-associated domain
MAKQTWLRKIVLFPLLIVLGAIREGAGSSGLASAPVARRPAAIPWKSLGRAVALLSAIGITVAIYLARNELKRLAVYGYPAVFAVSLLGNASLVLPAPSFAIVLVAGAILNPFWVGVVAGMGAAAGEMTGYLAGLGGQGVIDQRPSFLRLQRWMAKGGPWVILILGAVPNPFFDVGGIIAGMMRMPVWKFYLACWIGKSIRFGLLALAATIWA